MLLMLLFVYIITYKWFGGAKIVVSYVENVLRMVSSLVYL